MLLGAAAGAAAGVMLLSSGIAPSRELPSVFQEKELPAGVVATSVKSEKDKSTQIQKALAGKLPSNARPLSKQEEKVIEEELSTILGFPVRAELAGNRLNASYGYIGSESHLTRYPGDNLSTHFDSPEAAARYARGGWAGGGGAFGYFAPNAASLSSDEIEMEKYYVVAQTFASESWKKPGAYQWFKRRKFVVVNPANGKVAVGVLGDSGPALSTGKQFGGSPELMDSLGLYPPKAKQGVIFMFVDETGGPVSIGVK